MIKLFGERRGASKQIRKKLEFRKVTGLWWGGRARMRDPTHRQRGGGSFKRSQQLQIRKWGLWCKREYRFSSVQWIRKYSDGGSEPRGRNINQSRFKSYWTKTADTCHLNRKSIWSHHHTQWRMTQYITASYCDAASWYISRPCLPHTAVILVSPYWEHIWGANT